MLITDALFLTSTTAIDVAEEDAKECIEYNPSDW